MSACNIALFIAASITPKSLESYIDKSTTKACSSENTTKSLMDVASLYKQNFYTSYCQDCECIGDKKNYPDNDAEFGAIYKNYKYSATGVKKLNACPKLTMKSDVDNIDPMTSSTLASMELKYNCSGLCTMEPYFYFTYNSRGKPLSNCRKAITEFMASNLMTKKQLRAYLL